MNKIVLPPIRAIHPQSIPYEDCYTLGKQNTTFGFYEFWLVFLFDFALSDKEQILSHLSDRLKWTADGSFRYFACEADYIETQFKFPSLFDFKNGNPPYIEVTPEVEYAFKLYQQNRQINTTFLDFLENSSKICLEELLTTS